MSNTALSLSGLIGLPLTTEKVRSNLWIVMRGFKNPHENREFVTDITKRIIHVISFWTRQLSNFVFFHVNIKGEIITWSLWSLTWTQLDNSSKHKKSSELNCVIGLVFYNRKRCVSGTIGFYFSGFLATNWAKRIWPHHWDWPPVHTFL